MTRLRTLAQAGAGRAPPAPAGRGAGCCRSSTPATCSATPRRCCARCDGPWGWRCAGVRARSPARRDCAAKTDTLLLGRQIAIAGPARRAGVDRTPCQQRGRARNRHSQTFTRQQRLQLRLLQRQAARGSASASPPPRTPPTCGGRRTPWEGGRPSLPLPRRGSPSPRRGPAGTRALTSCEGSKSPGAAEPPLPQGKPRPRQQCAFRKGGS
mmetsp:Transcript_569/g.2280  ORF Transcript_569/g.2280 Transcript_569/m.2280 type:complete len:211 (+) Transcript_569:2006-2638(+)